MTDRSAHMTKDAETHELLVLADRVGSCKDLLRWTGTTDDLMTNRQIGLIVGALRAAARPAPDAGLVEREAFEAWVRDRPLTERPPFTDYSRDAITGEYQKTHVAAAWAGWQAALISTRPVAGEPVDVTALPRRDSDLVREVAIARTRLERFADAANAGQVHYSARELKRKIWAAFADVDALQRSASASVRANMGSGDSAATPATPSLPAPAAIGQCADADARLTPTPSGRDPATIEACAFTAENYDHKDDWSGDDDCNQHARVAAGQTCDDIAAAIRALAAPVVTEER